MFENPRRGRKERNFTTNVPKILDLKSSSEQIFSENWRWVPLVIRKSFFLPGDGVFPVVVSVVGSEKKKAQLLNAFKWSISERRVFDLIDFLIALVTGPCLGKPLELAFRKDFFRPLFTQGVCNFRMWMFTHFTSRIRCDWLIEVTLASLRWIKAWVLVICGVLWFDLVFSSIFLHFNLAPLCLRPEPLWTLTTTFFRSRDQPRP